MRCPDCSQRNSVAARKCQFCGTRFKRKPADIPIKLIGGVVGVGLVCGVAFAVVPLFHPGNVDLSTLAKQIAKGPKSPEEAAVMTSQLDAALMKYLEKNGNLRPADLLTKLQSELPTNAFEVLVFDLPKRMKLIEVDVVMEPTYYLVLNSDSGSKPVKVTGLKVFDEARFIGDPKSDHLILLGHTIEPVREPQLRALAISPAGDVSDETDKILPVIRGEGKADFVGKTNDVKIARTVLAAIKSESLFKGGRPDLKDENLETDLKWNNNKYEAKQDLGSGKLSALYSVAHSLVAPDEVDDFKSRIAPDVRETMKKLSGPISQPAEFVLSSSGEQSSGRGKRAKNTTQYVLTSNGRSFEVSLSSGKGTAWSVVGFKENAPAVASEEPAKIDNVDESTVAESSQPIVEETPKVVQEPVPAEPEKTRKQETKSDSRSKPVSTVANLSSTDESESESTYKVEKNREDQDSRSRKSRESDSRESRKSRDTREAKNSRDQADDRADSNSDRRSRDKDRKQTIAAQPVKSPEPPVTPAVASSEEPASGTARVSLSTGRVSVRSGPGTKFATIAQTRKDSELKVIGKEAGWYKVLVNGKKGYIYGGFVDYDKGDGYTTAVVKKKKSVHDEGHKSVHTPQPGDKLVILDGLKNDKYKVRLSNGKTGYVDKDAIDVSVDEPEFVP